MHGFDWMRDAFSGPITRSMSLPISPFIGEWSFAVGNVPFDPGA